MKGTDFFSDPEICYQHAQSRTKRCPQSSLARMNKQAIRERREGLSGGVSPGEECCGSPLPQPSQAPGITHRNDKTGPWPLLPRLDVYLGDELAAHPLPVGTRVRSTGERRQGHWGPSHCLHAHCLEWPRCVVSSGPSGPWQVTGPLLDFYSSPLTWAGCGARGSWGR